MAAREENILNVPLSETLEGMHVLCDTGDTGEPYRVAASLFIAEATQAAKDAVANLDPKDVILKGFTALTAGKPAITANSTLLAAIQSLYAMVGSGKVKIVSDGADQTGMVCWNGTSASGFVINVNEAAIYTRSQWTQSNPDSVTDANWIAAVKTGGAKNPFNALNTLLTGWVNRSTQKPTITSANTIFDALKTLYWASGNGNVLNISNGENRFGFVGWNANTAYGFMVDTANFTIYIRQWAQGMATSNANTAALWREAIQGGEAFSLKHPLNVYNYSGSGNIPSGDLAKVGAAEVFVYEIGGQRAPLLKVTGDDTMTQFSSAPIVESGDPSSGEPLKIHYMSVEVNLSTGTVKTDIVPISGSGGTSNVIHGEDITEGLEYLIPENVGDVVAFRSTMYSAQVPAEQEGFGFLAKVNGSESMAMMMQNDPAGGGKMKFFMGRVQNDGSGTEWQELTTGSSTGTTGPKVVFDDGFMFGGFNASHKGKLTLREPIPMGSIVTFYGSYSCAPEAEEYLLSPSTWVWSQTIPLPFSASNGVINIQNMNGIVDPSATPLKFFQQMAIIQVTSDDVVDGKIKSFTAYATGGYSRNMWITVEKVIFECIP